jgi:peptidoglycan/xylan/chitin deacetylase (PgdA/CDA1 family)
MKQESAARTLASRRAAPRAIRTRPPSAVVLPLFATCALLLACGDAATARSDTRDTAAVASDAVPTPPPTDAAYERAVALTIDDLPAVATRGDMATHAAITTGILNALGEHRAPAVGFVNEDKLRRAGTLDTARVALLRRWLDAGQTLGNHSYSHPDLHLVTLDSFQADVLRGEEVTRALLEERGTSPRWFRHPFLHTGRDLETKRGFESFLAAHGYRVAPVTIDNSDYIFARAYDHALDAADSTAARRIGEAYTAYMDTVFGFYEAQARAIVGEEIPQVLLLHANRLNAARLDDLLAMMRRRGYAFVSLDAALAHPAYERADAYVGPAGMTWLHRWAITAGMPGSTFAGEPPVPDWIAAAAAGG